MLAIALSLMWTDVPMACFGDGRFRMGTSAEELDREFREASPGLREMLRAETPARVVRVAGFCIDQFEVTAEEFEAFLRRKPEERAGRKAAETGAGRLPATMVTWQQARAYCEWAGKRLPSEAEWEFAARGGLRMAAYPWGDEAPTPARANYEASGIGKPVAVGSYPPNGYGLYDVAGNVWEFTADSWPGHPGRRVIRGGSFGGVPVNLRVAFRDSHPENGAGPHVGFRCAR